MKWLLVYKQHGEGDLFLSVVLVRVGRNLNSGKEYKDLEEFVFACHSAEMFWSRLARIYCVVLFFNTKKIYKIVSKWMISFLIIRLASYQMNEGRNVFIHLLFNRKYLKSLYSYYNIQPQICIFKSFFL